MGRHERAPCTNTIVRILWNWKLHEQESNAHIAANVVIHTHVGKPHDQQSQYLRTNRRSDNIVEALSLQDQ